MLLTSTPRTETKTADAFELLAVEFVAAASRRLPEDLRSLVFASPLSARSSDVCLIWHPGYREKHRVRIILRLIAGLPRDLLKGFVSLFPPLRRFRYAVTGDVKDRLLVVPSECIGETYISAEPSDAIYIYGPMRSGTKMDVRLRQDILRPFWQLIRLTPSQPLLALMWLSWVLSFDWLQYRLLHRHLSTFVSRYRIAKLGCIHEMHAHSRIVWSIAPKGYTVQHAAFATGKRWLFPHPNENVPTPDIFYVYDSRTADMLRPHYPKTTFHLGRSSRYPRHPRHPRLTPVHYLFATALPTFDNKTVISAMRKVSDPPTRLRQHPAVRRSETTLAADLESAIAVIGLGSTVLLEALALGIPVIQLTHPDFLDYLDIADIPGVTRIHHSDFSQALLKSLPPVDVEAARSRFGYSHDEVTYERLFL